MDYTKNPLTSFGIWGSAVSIAAGAAGTFGYVVTPEMQGEIVTLITAAAALIGGLVSLWGRWRARTIISTKAPL